MSFQAGVRYNGDVAIVDLAGPLTLGDGAGMLRETVKGLIDKGDRKILVKLSEVTQIDSAGLGEMVGAYASAAKAGGTVKLLHAENKVRNVLMMTKLFTIFESYNTEAIAVISFSEPSAQASGH